MVSALTEGQGGMAGAARRKDQTTLRTGLAPVLLKRKTTASVVLLFQPYLGKK